MIIKLDDPWLAVVAKTGHTQPGLLDRWPVSSVEPVVAEEVFNNAFSAIRVGGLRAGQQPDRLRAASERARQRRDDELIRVRARLRMLGACDA